ncbi:MAG: tRNA (adenosine(37)-N6)-dimethylallyltransferase MiaA, partial [Actinobacteria bacterium]|nr:tRNA (adenosine(37)-N6)-dimethylallyltransferase MiaA [Actinomycetota bacterium]
MQPVFVILGATAVGKTDLSLDLAELIDGEIINADSMQLYRGMDIGTAKLPIEQRRGIPHHMLDVLAVTEMANVSDYQIAGRKVIQDIHDRGKRAIVVGGSGLFIQSLLEDLQFPPGDAQVRARLEQECEELGLATLYKRLMDFDPEAGAKVNPANARRVIRALEVIEVTGQAPVTSLQALPEVVPSIRVGLRRERPELDQRISQRIDLMWKQGLVAEVTHLASQGLRDGVTARKALGYAQVLAALDGEYPMTEAPERTMIATRQFARRQDSWFGRDSAIIWRDANSLTA